MRQLNKLIFGKKNLQINSLNNERTKIVRPKNDFVLTVLITQIFCKLSKLIVQNILERLAMAQMSFKFSS